jgi:hypothetical protein
LVIISLFADRAAFARACLKTTDQYKRIGAAWSLIQA